MPFSSGSDSSSSDSSSCDYSSDFLYKDAIPSEPGWQKSPVYVLRKLVFSLLLTAVGIFLIYLSVISLLPPKALTPEYSLPDSFILDQTQLLDESENLTAQLTEMQKSTGICPIILTVSDADYSNKFDSLTDFAYSYYTDNYKDEQHFLLVISVSVPSEENNTRTWSMEGMQGNNTGKIISKKAFNQFRKDYENMLVSSNYSLTPALELAFKNMNNDLMKSAGLSSNLFLLIATAIWNLLSFFFLYTSIRKAKNAKKQSTTKQMEPSTHE